MSVLLALERPGSELCSEFQVILGYSVRPSQKATEKYRRRKRRRRKRKRRREKPTCFIFVLNPHENGDKNGNGMNINQDQQDGSADKGACHKV